MSDSQDGKNSKRARALAQSYTADESTGLWDPMQLQFMVDQGLEVPVGARFRAPTSATELASWGFAGGGASPDSMTGLQEYLAKNGVSLQDFQSKTGGLPLVFNDDGTATFDPSAQKQSFSYNNPDDGLFHKIAPLLFAGLATGGFGLANAAPATAAGGAMDMGVGLGGNLGAWGGITPIAEGAAGAVGAGAGVGAGALDGINWDLFNEVGSFAGDSSAGWDVASSAAGAAGGALDGINWDLLDEAGSFTGDASAGWDVAASAGGAGAGALDGVNWDLFKEPGSLKGFDTSGGFAGTAGSGGLLQMLQKLFNPGGGSGSTGTGGMNLTGVGTSAAQMLLSKYLADKYDTLARDLSDRADPFGSTNVKGLRADAQNEYKTQYSGGPAQWMETTYKPFAETNMDMALRKMAVDKGMSPSLNPGALADVVKYTTTTGFGDYMKGRSQVANEAGASVNPGTAASLYGQQSANAIGQIGNMGGALGSGISYATGGTGSQSGDNTVNVIKNLVGALTPPV